MDSGTRDGTPTDELDRLGGIGQTSEENPTSAQPAPTSRSQDNAITPAPSNAPAAAANPGNAGNSSGGNAGAAGGGAMSRGIPGSNINGQTGIGTGGYGGSWVPWLNWLLGPYPDEPGSGSVPDASGSGTDTNGAIASMMPGAPRRLQNPQSRSEGGGQLPEPMRKPYKSDYGPNTEEELRGGPPTDSKDETPLPASQIQRQPSASDPAPQAPPNGGPDNPGGGVGGYIFDAGYQVLAGDYTPDENRNWLGTAGEIGVGFIPIVSSVASARDLSQNLSNWQWSWGHALKTGANVVGLVPFARGVMSGGKAAVRGLTKAESAVAKTLSKADDAVNLEKRLAAANKRLNSVADAGQGGAPNTNWIKPKGWKLPKNGKWEGVPGNSNFKPTNPAALGLKPGEVVPFRNGYPDFSQWQRGNPLNVSGLNGDHANDMPLIYEKLAQEMGLPNPTAARNWLADQGLTPHHAGGNSVQLIPRDLHGGVRHTGGAWELRNQ
jgi:hypothetical protein